MSRGYCINCRGPCQRPEWITYAGGQNYANNDFRQQMAIAAWHRPVTTAAERAEAKAFVLAPSHACTSCGRFAFPDPGTLCFWCRRSSSVSSSPISKQVATREQNQPPVFGPAPRKRAKPTVDAGPTLGI